MSHAPFPPSSAKRWLSCTGSFGLGLQLPENPDSEYSIEGTRLHSLAATWLTVDGWKMKPPFTPDQLLLKPYIEHCNKLKSKAHETRIEQTVAHPRMPDLLYGTADFIAIGEEWIEVVDLKTGYGIMVDPEENEQLMCYAYLALLEMVPDEGSVKLPTDVRLTIVQPTDDTRPIKSWDTTTHAVFAWGKKAEEAIHSAIGGSTDLVPGEHCRWCKAKPMCPALRGIVTKAPAGELQMLADVSDLPFWLDKADLLEQWLDAVRKFAHEHIKNGGSIDGWDLRPKRAMRSWDDEEAVLGIARRRKIKIYQDKMMSPAMAERAHKNLPEELTKHIVSVSNGTNLVRSTGEKPKAAEVLKSDAEPMHKLMANFELMQYRR